MPTMAVEESNGLAGPVFTPFETFTFSPTLTQFSIVGSSGAAIAPELSLSELQTIQAELLKYKEHLKKRSLTVEANEAASKRFKPSLPPSSARAASPAPLPAAIKGKGKERESTPLVSPAPNIVPPNTIAPVSSHPLIRAASTSKQGAASSAGSEGSDQESSTFRVKKRKLDDDKKKRRAQVIDSDHEYSESEPPLVATTLKIKKLQEPRTASATPQPDTKSQQSTFASPVDSRAGSQTPAITLKLKIPSQPPTRPKPPVVIEPPPSSTLSQPIRKGPPTPGVADDFSLPIRSLVPPKVISVPPIATPKNQSEVDEDFSKFKPTSQTPFASFATSIEPYLRAYGDDDLAFLASKHEDLSPFLIPGLGRHYTEAWQEEDIALGIAPAGTPLIMGPSPLDYGPLQPVRTDMLTEEMLPTENIHAGPLTERLMSALSIEALPGLADSLSKDEDTAIGQTSANMDAVNLEDRIRRELNYLGVFPWEPQVPNSAMNGPMSSASKTPVLGSSTMGGPAIVNKNGEIDWSLRTDDEISTALRACQRRLRDQMAINETRKGRLADVVRDRLAYQEYEGVRDSLEKQIESGWIRRQRHHGKRKSGKGRWSEKNAPTESVRIPFPEGLVSAIEKRRKLVDNVAPIFQGANAGRFRFIPSVSVYGEETGVKTEEGPAG